MENVIFLQLYTFFIYFISGTIISIFFDIFRILRKTFKTPDIITYMEDIIFWLITGIFLISILFIFSNGEIRLYNIIAIIIGIAIYMLFISRCFIKINVKLLNIIKDFVAKFFNILIIPIKFIFRILKKFFKPFTFFVINFNKITKKFNNKQQKQKIQN